MGSPVYFGPVMAGACEACTFCSAAMLTAGCRPLDCMAALAGGNRLPLGPGGKLYRSRVARAEGSIAAGLESSVASPWANKKVR